MERILSQIRDHLSLLIPDNYVQDNCFACQLDLFYRLGVITVTLPPLRDRRDELELLIEFFSDEAAEQLERSPIRVSASLRKFFEAYDFPGNIRELRNLIYRFSCLAGDTAGVEHLPDDIKDSTSSVSVPEVDLKGATLAEVKKAASDTAEKDFLEAGLIGTAGSVTKLAEQIDVNRTHLQALLKKHGLRSKDFRQTVS